MLINKAINGAVIKIHIKHCIFNYNGHFGKVIGIKDMKLTRRYKEIAYGAGLTVEIYKSVDFIASILIENTKFSNNHGRSGAGTSLYIKNSPNNVTLKKLNYYNNNGIRFMLVHQL